MHDLQHIPAITESDAIAFIMTAARANEARAPRIIMGYSISFIKLLHGTYLVSMRSSNHECTLVATAIIDEHDI